MGWFSKRQDDEPTMADAWRMLGERLGLRVETDGDKAVHADGVVRGHRVTVTVQGRQRGTELLRSFATTNRKRVHQRWATEVTVGCANPRRLEGAVVSFVDFSDPTYDARNFEPSHCRVVRVEPDELPSMLVEGSIGERLSSIRSEPRIEIGPDRLSLAEERKVAADGGYFLGSSLHCDHPLGTHPWPERALVGPIWWIELLCDLADRVDGA